MSKIQNLKSKMEKYMPLTRREMLVGCCTGIAAMAGGRLRGIALGAETDTTQRDICVLVFLRGGCDGLSIVAPFDDPYYVANRPSLKLTPPGKGAGASLALPSRINPHVAFGLHPKASPLKEIYDHGDLAMIHACGLTNGTRSHFDAMDFIERGTPTDKHTATGWLTRHLLSIGATGVIPALAAGATQPTSLLGSPDSIVMNDVGTFGLSEHWKYGAMQRQALSKFYGDASLMGTTGR